MTKRLDAPVMEPYFAELRDLLLRERGIDISEYRYACALRRIAVRRRKLRISTLKEYVSLIRTDPDEFDRLLHVLTIHVTDFFRDRTLYDFFLNLLFPELIERKFDNKLRTLRFWCAGCSSGEEPVSLAIILEEALQRSGKPIHYRIYGTDIDRKALEAAKAGLYGDFDVRNVAPVYLEKYFNREGAGYRIAPPIALKIKYSFHNVMEPFPRACRLDMVLCRNVLIFLERKSQKAVFSNIRPALSHAGYLVLGKVEKLHEDFSSLFSVVNFRERVYRKTGGGAHEARQ
jgi:chemotaxis methyl-accepting protein methylase